MSNPKLATEQQVKAVSDTVVELYNHQGKQIKALESGVIDAIEPSSPSPTKRGEYKVTKPGVFLNFKDANGQPISVTQEDYSSGTVSIIFNGVDCRKLVIPITFEGEVKEGDTRGVSGGEVWKQEINNQNNRVTYKIIKRNENVDVFSSIVKNIFLQVNEDYDLSLFKFTYIGINNEDRKLLVQLDYNSKRVTFILNSKDRRTLPSRIIELLIVEDSAELVNDVRLFIEFESFVNYPTESFLLGGEAFNFIQILPKSFNTLELNNSFRITKHGVEVEDAVLFSLTVKNIFIQTKNNKYNNENIRISYYSMNVFTSRKVLIQLEYTPKNGKKYFVTYYTEEELSNFKGESYKLPIVEDSEILAKDIDVIIELHDFDKWPSKEFNNVNLKDYPRFILQENSFKYPRSLSAFSKVIDIPVSEKDIVIDVFVSKMQGNNAVQLALDKIIDASSSKKYVVNVANGLYKISKKEDFIGNPGYPAMVLAKDNVDIKGESTLNTVIYASLRDSPAELIDKYQTLYNWADNCTISQVTLVAENIRYTVHQDNGNESNKKRYYIDVNFIYLGNKGYNRAFGIGTWSGSETYVKGGMSRSQSHTAYSVHNNINFKKRSLWSFENHRFETLEDLHGVIEVNNCGSNKDCELILNRCSFSGSKTLKYREYWLFSKGVNEHFNHANYRIIGNNNQPVFFENKVVGNHLAFRSKSKNKGSKIRFSTVKDSVYGKILANPRGEYFGAITTPNIQRENEYLVKDGSYGLNAYAYGCVSILEKYYWPDGNTITDKGESLGKILGDCTGDKATYLDVFIDNEKVSIIFNDNYTNKSNAEIINNINGYLIDKAECFEYNIGSEYYAEFTDVVSIYCSNYSDKLIPKGSLVKLMGNGRLEMCSEEDELFGLLIDDLGAYELDTNNVITSCARVIKNCYVTTTPGNISSVRTEGTGNKYKVVNGSFVADPNGQYVANDSLIQIS